MHIRTAVWGVSAVLMSVLAMPGLTQAERINCKSKHYGYTYCRAKTHGRVRLVDRRSKADCIQGRSWGYDSHGVWVDNGCSARFEVGRRSGGGDDNYGHHRPAINWGHHNYDRQDSRVPNWAIGTFRGYNPRANTRVELRVDPSGRVAAKVGRLKMVGYFYPDSKEMTIGTQRFKIRKEHGGLRTVQVGNRDNVVHYERDR